MRRKLPTLLSNLIIIAAMLLIAGAQALAQSGGATTASLTGKVVDEQNAAIGGATIIARNIQTNFSREVNSAEDGSYLIIQLPPGSYEVIGKSDNFNTKSVKLDLVLGTTTLLNLVMKIGPASEVIEVRASETVDAGKTESSTNINRINIDSLPINKRNFLDFSMTAARVLPDRVPAQGASATSGLSFNGQTARFNNITIDGLDNNDLGSGSVRSTYSQDAVQEFQIISDGYSAEFGRAISGIVNIVTRGGSNDYHGNLFLFNRNDSLNARDAFSAIKPQFSQYQFGSEVSGPIKKDRLFFFGSFERLTLKQSNIVTISDATVQSGQRLGFDLQNGPIPFSVANSTALARIDARISDKDTIWARYNYGGSYNGALEPFGGLVAQTNAGIQQLNDNAIALSNTYINTRLNLVNETRFLFTRRDQNVLPINDDPQVRLIAPEGLVTFGRSDFLPQGRLLHIFQALNNTSISRAKQQIKFGVDYEHFTSTGDKTTLPIFAGGIAFFSQIDFAQLANMPGLPTLSGLQTLDPSLRTPAQKSFLTLLSALLPGMFAGFPTNVPLANLPLPLAYGQGFGDPHLAINGTEFSSFALHDIKVKPNLLLKLGVRYDLVRLQYEPKNNGNLSPRIAFSYNPTRLPKLNIHGAYGIFFAGGLIGQAIIIQLLGSGTLQAPIMPFPYSIVPFALPNHHYPESSTLPPGVVDQPQFDQAFVFSSNLRNSYSQQTSFGLDYALGNNTVASLNYIFVRGNKLVAPRNINPIVHPTGNPITSALTGRVDTSRGDVSEFESAFDSYYHGFTASINRRFNKFGLLAHYTYSKSIDDFIDIRPDIQEVVDPLHIGNERGLSLQDVRSRFVFSGVWDLNYSRNKLLSGYQVSTIISLNSGRPYNLIAGTDLNQNGDITTPGDRPLVGGVSLGRDVGITPGFANVDMRLTRTVTIKERYRIQGFFEAFNLFNRVNISDLNRIFPPNADGTFNLPSQQGGRYIATPDRFISAFAPRQFQLGFRISF